LAGGEAFCPNAGRHSAVPSKKLKQYLEGMSTFVLLMLHWTFAPALEDLGHFQGRHDCYLGADCTYDDLGKPT
jgi:hypothetical protein